MENVSRDIALVILAAGIGSRFGGVKQLEAVGPTGEVIIDYSIHDAIAAGFNKIVFILRRDIFEDFREALGDRLEAQLARCGVKWKYVFQELTDAPEGRTKPWGTGQALMSCREVLREPFAVINADDYYGREAYQLAYDFLSKQEPTSKYAYGMVGYILKNTLSENGGVTRGVCAMDDRGYLTKIDETSGIVKTADGAAVEDRPLDAETLVSMNLWMLTPEFVDELFAGFDAFRAGMKNPLKDEYLLPTIIDGMIGAGRATVKVVPTGERWFGVTYREDLPAVQEAVKALYDAGVYAPSLYGDIK